MGKVSINVNTPAIGQQHEFLVPDNMTVRDVIALMAKILASEYGVSSDTADLTLFDNSDSSVLDFEYSLSQLGISDGAKLILL